MFQQLLNQLSGLKQGFTEGLRKDVAAGKKAAEAGEYYPTVLTSVPGVGKAAAQIRGVRDTYQKELKTLGVSFGETPVQAAGALAGRLMTDITNDAPGAFIGVTTTLLQSLVQALNLQLAKKPTESLAP